jgi:hypothetical protein
MTTDRADQIIELLGGILEELNEGEAAPDRLEQIVRQLDAIEAELPAESLAP